MMDQSVTRRGQPCYYRVEGVNLIAINDSYMIEGAIYYLLKKHFRSEPYYVYLLDVLHDTTFQTQIGQLIDMFTAPEDQVDLSKFSLEKYVFPPPSSFSCFRLTRRPMCAGIRRL